MKHIKHIKQLLTILSLAPVMCAAQTSTENYVKTMTMLDKDNQRSMSSVQYYNGLGYPTVSVGVVGGSGQTAYSLTTYDALGREENKYLPLSKDNSIAYKAPETLKTSVASEYDAKAFSRTTYDALDRPLTVTTAGTAFSGKPSNVTYSANTTSDNVLRYVVSNDKLTKNSNNYPANSLTKETSKDPDGKTVHTFKDIFGHVILQRTVNGSTNYDTYYVYDALGLLRFVLPPKCKSASDLPATGYQYRYDTRGRVITKTLPGADSIKYWYDNADRMIGMRDARLRSAGKYRFYVYDKFDRLVVQGVCTSYPQAGTVRNATFSSSAAGLLGTSYVMPSDFTDALKNAQLELVNYYDMNQDNIKGSLSKYFSDIKITTAVSQRGQLTGTIVAASNGELTAQIMIYDVKGNLTNSRTKELGGRITSNRTSYSFTNKVTFSETYVAMPVGGSLLVTENWGYNSKIDKKSSYTLSLKHGNEFKNSINYTYDKLGRMYQITRNGLPTSVTRTVTYAYDMHGWLKSIKTNSFMEELFYADGPGTKLYNGNISSLRWKDNTSSAKRGYKFTYDGVNRMTAGVYGEGDDLATNTNRYTERMTYDANGNVTKVLRYGKLKSGYGKMDSLTISYNGNQPKSVTETVADYNYTGSFEYKKAKGTGYKFNTSGSLIADKSRGIAYITYDLNNNPEKIYFTNGSMTKYVYNASGMKLRAIHYTAKPNITRSWGTKPADLTAAQTLSVDSTDYVLGGNLVIKNTRIDKYLFEGGYAQATAANSTTDKFAFNYYNQDHLGNNREVVDASGAVTQVTNYYPFGAPYADASASKGSDVQPYKYNGKELDRMHGLNTYDYGARQHDPILARWDRIDPLCEKYYNVSPYNYCLNNPVKFIDPDGKEAKQANGGENFKRIGILTMAGGTLMVAAGTAYSIFTYGGGTVAGGGQLVSAGVATFKAGLVTYGAGVALDAHESIKKPDSIKLSDVSQKAHTPKKQSTGSQKRTEGKHMHGQTHGGGPKPNFKKNPNKRKKADEHRNKGKVIN